MISKSPNFERSEPLQLFIVVVVVASTQLFFSRDKKSGAQNQCDQIGQFLKVLGTKFAYISSPKRMVTFWAVL